MDQLTHVLAAGWRQFLEALHPDDRHTLLRVLREEEKRHRQEILDMLVKIDPYSLPPKPRRGSMPSSNEETGG